MSFFASSQPLILRIALIILRLRFGQRKNKGIVTVAFKHSCVVVTGGAGFIGSCLVRNLIRSDRVRVITLDKLTYAGNLDSLQEIDKDPLHHFVQGDICDATLVRGLLDEFQPSAIFHLAAESHVDRSIDGPAEFLQTNVAGTLGMLEESLRYWRDGSAELRERFRFLHVSTDEVYGSLGSSGAFTETTAYAPNSPYSASKAASDHFVRAFFHTYGLPVLITNCSNNYGPYQFPEKLVPLMILNALEGKPLPVYGDGLNIRDWLHVEDHTQALRTVLSLGEPGEVYNIGGNSERTNLDVVRTICRLLDERKPDSSREPRESLITYVKDRPGHDQRYAIDASKIKDQLGWQPTETFESGFAKTVNWYLDHPEWIQRVTSGVYRRERLGLKEEAETR